MSRLNKITAKQVYDFSDNVAGTQSPPQRHAYLSAAVSDAAKRVKNRPFRVLEIGAWAGASTITIGKVLKEQFGYLNWKVDVVDPWLPYFVLKVNSGIHYQKMNQLTRDGAIYKTFRNNIRFAGIERHICVYRDNSQAILPSMESRSYDLIYIDGDHTYPSVKYDLVESQKLVRPGGLICGDDLELSAVPGNVEQHEKNLINQKDYCDELHYHPGVTQAVVEEFGEISSQEGFWAVELLKQGSSANQVSMKFKDKTFDFNPLRIPNHIPLRNNVYVVSEQDSYNLVLADEGIVRVSHSCGPVDFSDGLEEVLSRFPEGIDLFIPKHEVSEFCLDSRLQDQPQLIVRIRALYRKIRNLAQRLAKAVFERS